MTGEEALEEALRYEPDQTTPPVPSPKDDFVIPHIHCRAASGQPYEAYVDLSVATDVDRAQINGRFKPFHRAFKLYAAITHLERQGMFLPSAGLTCNILAHLYRERNNPAAAAILRQYLEIDNVRRGLHLQNTIIYTDRDQVQILHYPFDDDFPTDGGDQNVNQSRGIAPFYHQGGIDDFLEEALKDPKAKRLIQDLTFLQDPSILVDLGDYLDVGTRVYIQQSRSENPTPGSTFIGYDGTNFKICSYAGLNMVEAVRGVKE